MGLFPGRTLEELDTLDINRLLRALAAKRIEAVEARRRLYLGGKVEAGDLTPAEWAMVREHDELMRGN